MGPGADRLTRRSGSWTGIVAGGFADRIFDVIALGFLSVVGAVLLAGSPGSGESQLHWGLPAALAASGLILAVLLSAVPEGLWPGAARRVRAASGRALRKRLLQAFLMAAALQLTLVLLNAWLGDACGINVTFSVWLFVWPIAKLSALLPFTQGGMGVREAALAGLLAPFGVSAPLAVAAGLAFQAIVVSGALVGGAIGLVETGDIIEIDIPNRTINLTVTGEEIAARRRAMEQKGSLAWRPVNRRREVTKALMAYAHLTTSASKGAVRDLPKS